MWNDLIFTWLRWQMRKGVIKWTVSEFLMFFILQCCVCHVIFSVDIRTGFYSKQWQHTATLWHVCAEFRLLKKQSVIAFTNFLCSHFLLFCSQTIYTIAAVAPAFLLWILVCLINSFEAKDVIRITCSHSAVYIDINSKQCWE